MFHVVFRCYWFIFILLKILKEVVAINICLNILNFKKNSLLNLFDEDFLKQILSINVIDIYNVIGKHWKSFYLILTECNEIKVSN